MDGRAGPSAGRASDPCASERSATDVACREAEAARAVLEQAAAVAREARRGLASARAALETAQANADGRRRLEAKQRLGEAYAGSRALAASDEGRRAALAAWASEVDRVNRTSRRARAMLASAQGRVLAEETSAVQAEQAETSARIRAEAAAAGCLQARMRLAGCEEHGPGAPAGSATAAQAVATEPTPGAETPPAAAQDEVPGRRPGPGGPATAPGAPSTGPLVIEFLVRGDHGALLHTANQIAARTGTDAGQCLMRLQQLVEALVSTAAERGFVAVDTRHPLWARLSFDEVGDVVRGLAELGFRMQAGRGWEGGRAPSPGDLSMALAYAGIEPRGMRQPPTAEQLRALPTSVMVDANAMLAREAPDLALDRLVRLLGERATPLGSLWDDWGQVRPLLLAVVPTSR